ncbi:MAG TPA: hypothetical protein VGQ00_00755 [Candidatus Norongarragalinales archaeon]|nr:hypothetical protein [Candidatus Norongarragalinales archaeon]
MSLEKTRRLLRKTGKAIVGGALVGAMVLGAAGKGKAGEPKGQERTISSAAAAPFELSSEDGKVRLHVHHYQGSVAPLKEIARELSTLRGPMGVQHAHIVFYDDAGDKLPVSYAMDSEKSEVIHLNIPKRFLASKHLIPSVMQSAVDWWKSKHLSETIDLWPYAQLISLRDSWGKGPHRIFIPNSYDPELKNTPSDNNIAYFSGGAMVMRHFPKEFIKKMRTLAGSEPKQHKAALAYAQEIVRHFGDSKKHVFPKEVLTYLRSMGKK